ncbi:MAG: hypothetical protein WCK35_04500 [Chloroflexota bacterium]
MNTLEITQSDLDAIREYKRHLAKKWWATELREHADCDHCKSPVPRDTGYLFGSSYLYCESCGDIYFGQNALENLRRSPSYFGSGVLEEARIFATKGDQDKKDSPRPAISFKEMDEITQRIDKLSLFDIPKKITAGVVVKYKKGDDLTSEEKDKLLAQPCGCFSTHIKRFSNHYAAMPPSCAIVATRCLTCGQQYWTFINKIDLPHNTVEALIASTQHMATHGTTIMEGSETKLRADIDKFFIEFSKVFSKDPKRKHINKDSTVILIEGVGEANAERLKAESEQTESETKIPFFKKLFNRK